MATNHIKITAPVYGVDKYYIAQANGGYSLNQRKDTRTGSVLPNCTGFASGWFNKEYNKLTGIEDGLTFKWFIFEAQNFWWQCINKDGKYYNQLKTGQTPQEGAMMVWSDSKNHNGHVAIVDEIISKNPLTLRIGESSASGVGTGFKFTTINNKNGRWGMSSAYTFLGFIYNPAIKEIALPVPVTQDRAYDQVKILKSTLRVRTTPNTSGTIIGLAKTGFYNYTEKTTANGYTWYKVGDFQWMAGVNGTLEDHPRIQVGDSCRTDAIEWKLKEIREDSYVIECSDGYAELKKDKIKF